MLSSRKKTPVRNADGAVLGGSTRRLPEPFSTRSACSSTFARATRRPARCAAGWTPRPRLWRRPSGDAPARRRGRRRRRCQRCRATYVDDIVDVRIDDDDDHGLDDAPGAPEHAPGAADAAGAVDARTAAAQRLFHERLALLHEPSSPAARAVAPSASPAGSASGWGEIIDLASASSDDAGDDAGDENVHERPLRLPTPERQAQAEPPFRDPSHWRLSVRVW